MSSLHDQAMQSIYQQVLDRVCNQMSRGQQASLQLLIQRLTIAAGGEQYIGELQLLLVQGGDRRSAHLLASLRAAQLRLALRGGQTFRLRVIVSCLPTPDPQMLLSHERLFGALFMQDDPRVELLMLEDDKVVPFRACQAQAMQPWAGARQALLMFGHLTEATPKALLGCRLHLQLAAALHGALDQSGGASALVTALPDRERRRVMAWGRRLLRLAGEFQGLGDVHQCAAVLTDGLSRLHMRVGAPLGRCLDMPTAMARELPLQMLAVDDLLCPLNEAHHLDAMLGPQKALGEPDTPLSAWTASSVVENLEGLHAHLLARQTRWQEWHLSQKDARASWWLRVQQQDRASFLQALGLDETQLVCLLSAPFNDQGKKLADFVHAYHPRMRVALPYLHTALQGKPCPETIKHWLVEVSGLSLAQLQAVYAGRLEPSAWRVLVNLTRRDAALRWLSPLDTAPAIVRQAAL
ncbi:hypothetical protein [Pseudomonas putida]|uniref:hypothetical protein n=1 Tax=Pseudomonas putida TaxID=303 RepID=UPI00301C1626